MAGAMSSSPILASPAQWAVYQAYLGGLSADQYLCRGPSRCNLLQPPMLRRSLKEQNDDLATDIQRLQAAIHEQREANQQHQAEIETLLNFNERLLSIIQDHQNNHHETCSLQAISQRSERDSDLAYTPLAFNPKPWSPKHFGVSTFSSAHAQTKFLKSFGRQVPASERDHTESEEQDEVWELRKKSSMATQAEEAKIKTEQVHEEVTAQKEELRRFRKESNQFYDRKIQEIRGLSERLAQYSPRQHIDQIQRKLRLSPSTTALINQALRKGRA